MKRSTWIMSKNDKFRHMLHIHILTTNNVIAKKRSLLLQLYSKL